MDSIEITINSIGNDINIFIDTINYKTKINDIEKEISKEKLNELIRIIRVWHPIYQNKSNKPDIETFIIKINTNEGTDIIKGEGDFPNNYIEFKNWIGEFYE